MSRKWLTNAFDAEAATAIAELSNGGRRVLVKGPPQATEDCSVTALKRMDVVGIYELEGDRTP